MTDRQTRDARFEELMLRHLGVVHHAARAWVADPGLAEDPVHLRSLRGRDEPQGPGLVAIGLRAAYDVCEGRSGVCLRLRQDFRVVVTVDPRAPSIE